jgi:beta-glucosidase-like glycosyl hydrolase
MQAGAQEMDSNGHPKMITFLKHFTAYSMESNRMHSEPIVSAFDMHDSYLPQYKIAFTEGTARGGA